MADLFTQKHSKNEETNNKDLDFLTISYGIVFSSINVFSYVLFGYGNFICINKIDIIL